MHDSKESDEHTYENSGRLRKDIVRDVLYTGISEKARGSFIRYLASGHGSHNRTHPVHPSLRFCSTHLLGSV